MLAGENGSVLQKCTSCEKVYLHDVNCTTIHDGLEQRVYTCRNCQKVTHNEVPHNETIHDKIRREKNSKG